MARPIPDPEPFRIPCPIEDCVFEVVVPAVPPRDGEMIGVAAVRHSERAAEIWQDEIIPHAEAEHDQAEFVAACEAVAAGLR